MGNPFLRTALIVLASWSVLGGNCDPKESDFFRPLVGGGPSTGGLDVLVVQAGTSTPIAGANVTVTGPGGVTRTGTTGPGGLLQFLDLPPGLYTVSAEVPGHACSSAAENVTAGQTTNVIVPCTAQPTTGTLVVTVVDNQNNQPIAGANVTATPVAGAARTGTTDANGRVTFSDAAPGPYNVTATSTGRTCTPQTAAVTAGQTTNVTVPCASTGVEFTVVLNNPPPGWNHTMPGVESVECKVITTNPPQPGATFTVQATGPSVIPGQNVSGTLDDFGVAVFQVRINQLGTYTNVVTVTSGGVQRMASAMVTVTAAANTCPVAPSSARFKSDVVSLLPEGASLLGLRPVAFRYREPWGDPALARVGLIAEEVARVHPGAVLLDAGGAPEAIHYGILAGLVLDEIQRRAARALVATVERLAEAR